MTLGIAVHGAAGRMGRAVLAGVLARRDARVVCAVELPGSPYIGADAGLLAGAGEIGVKLTDDLKAVSTADVVIDFTTPNAVAELVDVCVAHRLATVIGTTGLSVEGEEAVTRLAAVAPVVRSPNFSVGVTVLLHLAARAVELLGPEYDAEIIEMHHRNKADAPSGTALALAESVRAAKGLDQHAFVHGRSGTVGARPVEQIGVMTLRGGDVVGDHTLVLAGPGERLELIHRAHERTLFARGALRAAGWVVGKAPGRYSMAHVLGIGET